MIEAVISYGPFKRGHDYKVIDEGYDWYLIAVGGSAIYAFKWIFDND